METNNQKNDQNIIPNDADKQQKGVNVPNLRFNGYTENWQKRNYINQYYLKKIMSYFILELKHI